MKILICFALLMSVPGVVSAHAGAHGNDECIVVVGNTELRLSGYQFKGRNPEKHYCRYLPHLGKTVIKIDSVSADLSNMGLELQVFKRNSWWGLILQNKEAYSQVNALPVQYFAKQVVSISSVIQDRDIYLLKFRLHQGNGGISEEQFHFFVGIPFTQVMVGIAFVLLILIVVIFISQLCSKRRQGDL